MRSLRLRKRLPVQSRQQFMNTALAVIFVSASLMGCTSSAPVAEPAENVIADVSRTTELASTSTSATVPVSSVMPDPKSASNLDSTPTDGVAVGASGGDRFPDVIGAKLVRTDPSTFEAFVTISSPYDTPERYADAWRILDNEGKVLGVRELTHDHQTEQPFERSLPGVVIDGQTFVVVEGRDQLNGWGGQRWQIRVPLDAP
jgi:hypothetical protein